MAISKAMGAMATDASRYVSGPAGSVHRLEQALKSGNAHQAKLALETVKQSLPIGQGSSKDMAAAVTAMDKAIGTGDLSKATEVLSGVKEQAKKLEVQANDKRLDPASLEGRKDAAVQAATPANVGVLDIKA